MQSFKPQFKFKNFRLGFTLIELLIVIAIIGILSSLLLSNFVGVRQRARDGARKSDLRQIQTALELYRSDQGTYPSALPSCMDSFIDGADPPVIYMQKIPCDPSTNTSYIYSFDSVTSKYSLIACLENGNDSQKDESNVAPCNGKTGFSYTLQNP